MNAYYDDFTPAERIIISENGSARTKKAETSRSRNGESALVVLLDMLLGFIDMIMSKISADGFLFGLKAGVGFSCFITFIGVIGAMEAGNISAPLAIVIALFLLFVEVGVSALRVKKRGNGSEKSER